MQAAFRCFRRRQLSSPNPGEWFPFVTIRPTSTEESRKELIRPTRIRPGLPRARYVPILAFPSPISIDIVSGKQTISGSIIHISSRTTQNQDINTVKGPTETQITCQSSPHRIQDSTRRNITAISCFWLQSSPAPANPIPSDLILITVAIEDRSECQFKSDSSRVILV